MLSGWLITLDNHMLLANELNLENKTCVQQYEIKIQYHIKKKISANESLEVVSEMNFVK